MNLHWGAHWSAKAGQHGERGGGGQGSERNFGGGDFDLRRGSPFRSGARRKRGLVVAV